MKIKIRKTISYPIQLTDFMSQLVLPRDLTQWEADRICALIQTLVIPEMVAR